MAGPYETLAAKRAGERLTEGAIRGMVRGAVDGSWSEGQLGAFLMAAALQGLDTAETGALTRAMLESGESWSLEETIPLLCDKHSTGGVGDKVSLILSPILAACGLPVAMLTGRGLAHTGGTADKLETIPGIELELDRNRCLALLENVGMAIGIATAAIAPADGRLYGLRDATATVDCLPLITASILSKKLATGAAGLVFDVKTGSGAVFEETDRAEALARSLVDTAAELGSNVSALLTDMSQPLGRWVGNTVEVRESLACLGGEGPSWLMDVVYALCEEVSALVGQPLDRTRLESVVDSGAARDRFVSWVEAQGGDPGSLERLGEVQAPVEVPVLAERGGYLQRIACKELGFLMVESGVGRIRDFDPDVALNYRARLGDRVEPGDEIARAYLRSEEAQWLERARACFEIGSEPAPVPAPVGARVRARG